MIIQNRKIIYNKIEQGLINILVDFVIMKHARLGIPKMIISSGEFIISHESQGPMKMQRKEVTAGKTGSLKLEGQMSNQRNRFGAVLKKNFVKLRWKPGVVSMVLFSKGKKWHS